MENISLPAPFPTSPKLCSFRGNIPQAPSLGSRTFAWAIWSENLLPNVNVFSVVLCLCVVVSPWSFLSLQLVNNPLASQAAAAAAAAAMGSIASSQAFGNTLSSLQGVTGQLVTNAQGQVSGSGNKSEFVWQLELGKEMNFFCMTVICNRSHLWQINNVDQQCQEDEKAWELFLYFRNKTVFFFSFP